MMPFPEDVNTTMFKGIANGDKRTDVIRKA